MSTASKSKSPKKKESTICPSCKINPSAVRLNTQNFSTQRSKYLQKTQESLIEKNQKRRRKKVKKCIMLPSNHQIQPSLETMQHFKSSPIMLLIHQLLEKFLHLKKWVAKSEQVSDQHTKD